MSTGPLRSEPSSLADLLARDGVVARITELFLATDRKDWPAVEACFAPEVLFDMSSAGAGPASSVAPSAITAGWQVGLAQIEHVHHQAGNFVVRLVDDRAEAFCYGIAYHYRARKDGRNTRVFVGSYDFHLTREAASDAPAWRITLMRFNLEFIDGNPTLEAAE